MIQDKIQIVVNYVLIISKAIVTTYNTLTESDLYQKKTRIIDLNTQVILYFFSSGEV